MGVASAVVDAFAAVMRPLLGRSAELSPAVLDRFPELRAVRFRRGGLPVRVGGWCLGQSTVSAITLWRTIWLAPELTPSAELLLHELRHVHQFQADAAFPMRYLWESLRHGYVKNRFEVDARAYAAARVSELSESHPQRKR